MRKEGHFYYRIYNFVEKCFFYKVKNIFRKRLCAWRNFKNIFSRPLFTIIFRPKIVFLDTDSILRVNTMYEISQVRRVNKVGTIFSLVGIGCTDLPIRPPPNPGSYGPAMLVGVPHSSPPS